jgi:hypothetical protein
MEKFYPKGEDAPRPNAEGQYLVKTKDGFQHINRQTARRKLVSRLYTKKGFKGHEVNPPYDPKMQWFQKKGTNHERMLERKKEREFYRSATN